MLISLTALLAASSIAMLALLWAKHWELSTGKMLLPAVRPSATERSLWIIDGFERQLPRALQTVGERGVLLVRRGAREVIARAVLSLERVLEDTLDALRRGFAAPRSANAEPSNFLREVAEHKRRLTRTARAKRVIVAAQEEPAVSASAE